MQFRFFFSSEKYQLHQKSNLWKLKEADAALEGEGFGHGVGSLVVVVVVAAVLVVVVPAALLPGHVPGTRGVRPGGVEENRHEVQPECHPFVVQIVLHPGCDFQRQVLLLLQPELWPRSAHLCLQSQLGLAVRVKVWSVMAVRVKVWSVMAVRVKIWLVMAVRVKVWSVMAVRVKVWSVMAVRREVWSVIVGRIKVWSVMAVRKVVGDGCKKSGQ